MRNYPPEGHIRQVEGRPFHLFDHTLLLWGWGMFAVSHRTRYQGCLHCWYLHWVQELAVNPSTVSRVAIRRKKTVCKFGTWLCGSFPARATPVGQLGTLDFRLSASTAIVNEVNVLYYYSHLARIDHVHDMCHVLLLPAGITIYAGDDILPI